MADCDNDQECEKIVPTPIKPEPLPKQCSGGDESGGGTNDFNELDNRPKYDGRRMTGDTNIPAYSDFTGTDGQSDGTAGLVPAPTTADADKFLKSDGTWATAGGGSDVNVVQTTGTSETDVMSQKAASEMVFSDPTNKNRVTIGNGASNVEDGGVAIGREATVTTNAWAGTAIGNRAKAKGNQSIAIGQDAEANSSEGIAIGKNAKTTHSHSIAFGVDAITSRAGEINIGTGNYNFGFNSSKYRVIGGVYDGQSLHDAATVAQGNTLATSAPTTATVGVLGQLYTDTTTMHTYQCTAINNSEYTWTQRW